MQSVQSVQFNLMQRLLTVDHSPLEREAVAQAIRSLGFTAELPESKQEGEAAVVAKNNSGWPLALACAAAGASGISSFAGVPGSVAGARARSARIAVGPGADQKGRG